MSATTPAAKLPVVMVVKVVRQGAVRVVKIRCCWCRATHWHGWPMDHADVGSRLSHRDRRGGAPVRSYYVHADVAGGAS